MVVLNKRRFLARREPPWEDLTGKKFGPRGFFFQGGAVAGPQGPFFPAGVKIPLGEKGGRDYLPKGVGGGPAGIWPGPKTLPTRGLFPKRLVPGGANRFWGPKGPRQRVYLPEKGGNGGRIRQPFPAKS